MILHNAVGRSGLAALIVAVFLVACATEASYVAESRRLIAEGRGEEALVLLDKVSREDPDDHAARSEGAPFFNAMSWIFTIFSAWASEREPPKTVKS